MNGLRPWVLRRYLFTGSFVAISRRGEPVLLIDREWNVPNAKEMAWVEDVRWYPYGAFRWQFDEVARVFAGVGGDLGLRPRARIGILELETPTLYHRALARAFPEAELAECREVWGDLVRSPITYDLAMVRRTAAVADAGMRAALDACREGLPEYEAGFASLRAAALGAEFFHGGATSTHVNLGAGSTVISNVRPYLFTAKRLERGDMFWLDLSAMYAGYYPGPIDRGKGRGRRRRWWGSGQLSPQGGKRPPGDFTRSPGPRR